MKYESSILKRLIDTYGVVGNHRYISEIIKEFIVRGKECFPNLFTYQSDWLAHIDEFGLNPSYTVSYTGQSIYTPNTLERPVKSAILKGSTKYRDIDTGEILETFEEGRNLELVSVKTPDLKTTGKNLFNFDDLELGTLSISNGELVSSDNVRRNKSFISVDCSKNFSFSMPNYSKSEGARYVLIHCYNINKEYIRYIVLGDNLAKYENRPFLEGTKFVKFTIQQVEQTNPTDVFEVQFEYGKVPTTYEPYKSNILTTPSDLELRGIDDVKDELNCLTGELTERVGEIVLDGSEDWKLSPNFSSTYNSYYFVLNVTYVNKLKYTNDKYQILSASDNLGKNIGLYIGNSSGKVAPFISCDKMTLSEFKDYLSKNPITLQYQLATESIKTVDLTILDQNGQSVDHLKSFNGGTHVYTSSLEGSLVPSVDISVVTNLEETLKICSLEGNTM